MSTLIQTELERINVAWAALDHAISGLSQEQLATIQRDHWTLKDHLAHMALGEQYWVAALNNQPLHEIFATDRDTLLGSSDDELNELGYRQTYALSVPQVQALRRQSHQALLNTLARLTEDDLRRPFVLYGSEVSGTTLLDILHANTYVHYDTHRTWIEQMLM